MFVLRALLIAAGVLMLVAFDATGTPASLAWGAIATAVASEALASAVFMHRRPAHSPDMATQRPAQQGGGVMEKVKEKLG